MSYNGLCGWAAERIVGIIMDGSGRTHYNVEKMGLMVEL
jgi:hypothetical protein